MPRNLADPATCEHEVPDSAPGTVTKCRRCRRSFRIPTRKKCSKCQRVKSLDEFPILRRSGDGHHGWCLACKRTYGTNPDMVVRVPPAVMAAIRREREQTGRSLSGIVCDTLTSTFAPGTACQYNHADSKGKRQQDAARVEVLVTTKTRAEAETARLWRALDAADLVVIDDDCPEDGEPRRAAVVVAPRHFEKVARFLGGRPELLPEPGACDDYLAPPEEASP